MGDIVSVFDKTSSDLSKRFNQVATKSGGSYVNPYDPALSLEIEQNSTSTMSTSSLGLTKAEDDLINAAHAAGGDTGYLGRADQFGFQEAKQEKRKAQEKKRKKDREFVWRYQQMLENIENLKDSIDQGIKNIKKHIKVSDQLGEDLNDDLVLYIKEKDEAIAFRNALQEAIDNKDFGLDENGNFKNKALQQLREKEKKENGNDIINESMMMVLVQNTINHYDDTYIPSLDNAIVRTTQLIDDNSENGKQGRTDLNIIEERKAIVDAMEPSDEQEAEYEALDQDQSIIDKELDKKNLGIEEERNELKQEVIKAAKNKTENSQELTVKADVDILSDEFELDLDLGEPSTLITPDAPKPF